MRNSLLAQTRTYYVLAFLGLLAWVFGVYPPAWQRVLIVALTVAAVATVAALDDLKARYVQYPRYDKAA